MSHDWARPPRLGLGGTSDSMSQVAAPLLAGFSVTLIGLLVQAKAESMRWTEGALILVTLAAACFVASLQCGFHARQYFYSPADVDSWFPRSKDEEPDPDLVTAQCMDQREWRRWYKRSSLFYDLGIFALASGLVLVLSPPEAAEGASAAGRWSAASVAAMAAVAELVWWVKADLALWGRE